MMVWATGINALYCDPPHEEAEVFRAVDSAWEQYQRARIEDGAEAEAPEAPGVLRRMLQDAFGGAASLDYFLHLLGPDGRRVIVLTGDPDAVKLARNAAAARAQGAVGWLPWALLVPGSEHHRRRDWWTPAGGKALLIFDAMASGSRAKISAAEWRALSDRATVSAGTRQVAIGAASLVTVYSAGLWQPRSDDPGWVPCPPYSPSGDRRRSRA